MDGIYNHLNKMINTIIFFLLLFGFNSNFVNATTPIPKPDGIQGTWKTEGPQIIGDPVYTVIIDEREIFICMFNRFSGGYKQLLTYKIVGNKIMAKEKEILFFDQNIGNITAHYKHRSNKIQLILNSDTSPPKLVLEPAQPGSVLIKDSDSTAIDFKAKDEFKWLRKCPYFKSDY